MTAWVLLILGALWAGAQNALAGGRSFITLPALMLTGMDARAANITSTIALFPAQIVMGVTGRAHADAPPGLSFRALFVISLVGGALGGLILLATPSSFFARLVPWLVLFATVVFAWGSFFSKPKADGRPKMSSPMAALMQFGISIYGGYFGGGIGFLMLAALTTAGLAVRDAGAMKNVLAGVMNASAVAIFVFSHDVHWPQVDRDRLGRLARRLGRSADAAAGQREGAARGGGRDRRRADDRAVLARLGTGPGPSRVRGRPSCGPARRARSTREPGWEPWRGWPHARPLFFSMRPPT